MPIVGRLRHYLIDAVGRSAEREHRYITRHRYGDAHDGARGYEAIES
ncbi:MAG: hypothetical protein ABI658_10385 [Acidimicrobiales bacterium]